MSKKIGFLQRWMFIIDKINAYPYISLKELQRSIVSELANYDGVKDIGTDKRTIKRDLDEIRSSPFMDISIEYYRPRNGYYIPHDEKSDSKLDRMFELSSLLSFSSLKDIVFMEDRKCRGLEHRFGLITAIRKSVEVMIEYKKFGHSQGKKGARRLHPYAIKEYRNRWYLLAVEAGSPEKEKYAKVWGLDRIEKLEVTNRKFNKDKDIDLKKQFEHCFGIFTNPEMEAEKVVLSFSPLSERYNDSLPLHESQKTLIRNDQEYRIELKVKLTQDFIMELLSQSEGMRVIEPVSLRENLIDIHLKAIGLLRERAD